MIHLLDDLLRKLILAEQIENLTSEAQLQQREAQIGFRPPDENWRLYVDNLTVGGNPANALNVYLVDLRDNRKLHSNERLRSIDNGFASDEPAPSRLDCHYLISAWSPAQATPAIEPTLDEHALLYEVTEILMRTLPLNPSRIYTNIYSRIFPSGSIALKNALDKVLKPWGRFQDADLPTVVAPPDGYIKLSEFWHGMGQNSRLRPVLYLITTLPVALIRTLVGALVTTRITEYRQVEGLTQQETFIQIGGYVRKTFSPLPDGTTVPPAPVVGAWVQLATLTNTPLQTTTTDEMGRFTFAGLVPGTYRVVAKASGLGELPAQTIDVPSPSGEYDLRFP
jgi:hypothetical protein